MTEPEEQQGTSTYAPKSPDLSPFESLPPQPMPLLTTQTSGELPHNLPLHVRQPSSSYYVTHVTATPATSAPTPHQLLPPLSLKTQQSQPFHLYQPQQQFLPLQGPHLSPLGSSSSPTAIISPTRLYQPPSDLTRPPAQQPWPSQNQPYSPSFLVVNSAQQALYQPPSALRSRSIAASATRSHSHSNSYNPGAYSPTSAVIPRRATVSAMSPPSYYHMRARSAQESMECSDSGNTSHVPDIYSSHLTNAAAAAAAAAAGGGGGGGGGGGAGGRAPPGLPSNSIVPPGIVVKTKFPTARIKRIMQADEEVGKVAQAAPIAVGKALELFMIQLVTSSASLAQKKGTKRISSAILKEVIETEDKWDFLREITSKVDVSAASNELAGGGGSGAGGRRGRGAGSVSHAAGTVKQESDSDDIPAVHEVRKRGRRKKSEE